MGSRQGQEWPEGWAAEVPKGTGASAVLGQLVGGSASQAGEAGQGAEADPVVADPMAVEPAAPDVPVEMATAPALPVSPAAEDAEVPTSPAAAALAIAAARADEAAKSAAGDPAAPAAHAPAASQPPPSMDTPARPPQPAPSLPATASPLSAGLNQPSAPHAQATTAEISTTQPFPPHARATTAQPSPSRSEPSGRGEHTEPSSHVDSPRHAAAGHRRRVAVGVGAAAFLAVGLAAALTGGGFGSTPSRGPKQPDALGAPLAFPPGSSSDSATYGADQATVTDPSASGAPTSSSTPPTNAGASSPNSSSQGTAPGPLTVPTTGAVTGAGGVTDAAGPPPTTAVAAPPLTYSAITGWACAQNGSATFRPVGESDGSTDGWKIVGGDDGTGSGCSGGWLAMPMSGDAGIDAANHSDWTFTIAPAIHGTCQITVFIPRPASSAGYEVGGTSALYGVYNGPSVAGLALIDSFPVDQAAHRGGSVTVSVAVNQPILRIRLHDQGVDYTSSPKLMYGVGAVRVTCTGN